MFVSKDETFYDIYSGHQLTVVPVGLLKEKGDKMSKMSMQVLTEQTE